jgi:hypothetical protein
MRRWSDGRWVQIFFFCSVLIGGGFFHSIAIPIGFGVIVVVWFLIGLHRKSAMRQRRGFEVLPVKKAN